ncbi:MAG: FecR domain-containing protein, partial [Rhodospirillaceae bacterium]|nr:FecR domain-containing protein [Rhodospirillaceae bacterium]
MALDTVETGDAGGTSMRFLDETRFDVGPNAMVRLDEFVFDPASAIGAGHISMAVGAFRYVGGNMKSDENVKLVTPTATMTIRGTELIIYVGLDGTTEINIVEGAVEVQPCDKPVSTLATAGQRVIVPLTCAAVTTTIRTEFAELDVPADLADFATAAGGEDEGGGDEGGGPPDKDAGPNDGTEPSPGPSPEPDPEPSPEPEPEPEPEPDNDNEGGL